MARHDVIVIGAGLAGLRCAMLLARAGRSVLVLEAADAVGGRQRTDRVDGFLLDRGFQVLNPRYPAIIGSVDVPALDMRAFPVGVQVQRVDDVARLWHPLRHPHRLATTLRSAISAGYARPAGLAALARWAGPALVAPRRMVAGSDRTLAEGWDAAGLQVPLRREVLEPFLAGVLADDDGSSSDAFARLLVRLFATSRPGLPSAGIAALPRQLASAARTSGAEIRVGRRVDAVTATGAGWRVAVAGEETAAAEAVVVAVGPEAVGGLTGLPTPEMRGLQTWWFATDEAPDHPDLLAVDGTRDGPVVNSAVVSQTVPTYAPVGRHLVQATCLYGEDAVTGADTEIAVRRQLTRMWAADAARWELLRRDDIPHALPLLRPPMRRPSPATLGDGLFVAGDHRDSPSIQGALSSGARAAEAVLSGR